MSDYMTLGDAIKQREEIDHIVRKYSKEVIEEIQGLIRTVATCERILSEVKVSRAQYRDVVKKLMSPRDINEALALAEEASKLIAAIEKEDDAYREYWFARTELWKRYGIKLPKGERYPFIVEVE